MSMYKFCSLPCMKSVTERSVIVHICLPGQQNSADDHSGDFPNLQEMCNGVISILNLLHLQHVILLGVGAGANIALRVALCQPCKVLGLIVVQPVVSAANLLDQVRGRSIVADLKTNYGRESDQFLVQHNFGNLDNPSDELLIHVNKYKEELHNTINPRNLQLYVDSFFKRKDLIEQVKKEFKTDILIVTGSNSYYSKQADSLNQVLINNMQVKDKVSYIKIQDAANILLEAPTKLSEAILLFCQGLGMVPAVLGSRKRSLTRGLSMSEADKPNISRLSLSE